MRKVPRQKWQFVFHVVGCGAWWFSHPVRLVQAQHEHITHSPGPDAHIRAGEHQGPEQVVGISFAAWGDCVGHPCCDRQQELHWVARLHRGHDGQPPHPTSELQWLLGDVWQSTPTPSTSAKSRLGIILHGVFEKRPVCVPGVCLTGITTSQPTTTCSDQITSATHKFDLLLGAQRSDGHSGIVISMCCYRKPTMHKSTSDRFSQWVGSAKKCCNRSTQPTPGSEHQRGHWQW